MLCAHFSRISKQPGPSTHTEVSEQSRSEWAGMDTLIQKAWPGKAGEEVKQERAGPVLF